jgi:exodeoxyribonuclease-3
MRIATWNVNGLRARLEFVRHWLRARQPDVVGLQELKLTDEQFPHEAFAELGYRSVSFGQKSWNGVAILAKEEPQVTQRGLPDQDSFGSRLITAEVEGLSFTTVYCPNGKHLEHDDFPRKLAWFDALADHMAAADPTRPTVLCGDFNICHTGLDSWDEARLQGEIFHTVEERARLTRLLDLGFVDTFREKNPELQVFSWWDYRGGAFHRKQGLRIDLILASPPAMARVKSVEIDREYRKKQDGLTASDHAPVIADLA